MLVRQGLPLRRSDQYMEPHMCVPVSPTSDHPASRKPITPTRPLPWDGCYVETPRTVNVRVRGEYRPDNTAMRVEDKADIKQVITCFYEDQGRRQDLRATAAASRSDGIPTPKAPSGAMKGGKSKHFDEDAALEQKFDLEATIILLRASYDLVSVDAIADPEHFYEEQALLTEFVLVVDFLPSLLMCFFRIITTAKARSPQRKEEAIKRTQELDRQAYGDSIMPEERPPDQVTVTHEREGYFGSHCHSVGIFLTQALARLSVSQRVGKDWKKIKAMLHRREKASEGSLPVLP